MNAIGLLSETQLMAWSGYTRRKELEAFLVRQNIGYAYAKGNKLITTQSLIDAGLAGGNSAAKNSDQDAFFNETQQSPR